MNWKSPAAEEVRARADGLLHLDVALGQTVRAGERIGALYNSFGRRLAHVSAELSGVVLGEYSIDSLLRYGTPTEVLARYADGFEDLRVERLEDWIRVTGVRRR